MEPGVQFLNLVSEVHKLQRRILSRQKGALKTLPMHRLQIYLEILEYLDQVLQVFYLNYLIDNCSDIIYSDLNSPCFAWHPYEKEGIFNKDSLNNIFFLSTVKSG